MFSGIKFTLSQTTMPAIECAPLAIPQKEPSSGDNTIQVTSPSQNVGPCYYNTYTDIYITPHGQTHIHMHTDRQTGSQSRSHTHTHTDLCTHRFVYTQADIPHTHIQIHTESLIYTQMTLPTHTHTHTQRDYV